MMKRGMLFLLCIGTLSVLLSGCESYRAISTLKPQHDANLSQSGVRFRIDEVWTLKGRECVSAAECNALAMKAYPLVFSNEADAWPFLVTVKRSLKASPDLSSLTSLPWLFTLGLFPMCVKNETEQYEIGVAIPGVESNPNGFEIETVGWVGWIPLLFPAPGSGDVRSRFVGAKNEIGDYKKNCIVEAVAKHVKALNTEDLSKFQDPVELIRLAVRNGSSNVCETVYINLKRMDQTLLAKIAVEDKNWTVRRVAVGALVNQVLLSKIAMEDKYLGVRLMAIGNVTDQALLRQWAEKDPQAAIRQAAVARIRDDGFLLKRLPLEPSAAVRGTLVQTLQGNDALRQVVLRAYHQENRVQAWKRLPSTLSDRSSEVAAADAQLDQRVAALAMETDTAKLKSFALSGEFDVLRTAAVRRLNDPGALEQVALRADDREVQKIVLAKLVDKEALKRIAATAADLPMRLASAKKSTEKTWSEIFDTATASDATAAMLGDALAAVSLFPDKQSDAVHGVQQACLNMIRRGNESRIPEMVELLEGYGDKTLGEDYLNCGQPDLNGAGASWANRRGYNIRTGGGSHRASWGSGQ